MKDLRFTNVLKLGSYVACETVEGIRLVGQIGHITEHSVVVLDDDWNSHIVSKFWLLKHGFAFEKPKNASNKKTA